MDSELSRAQRFKRIRKNNKLSQVEISKLSQVSQQTWSLWERSEDKSVHSDVLVRLYEVYKTNPIWLLTGNGQMESNKSDDFQESTLNLLQIANKLNIDVSNLLEKAILNSIFEKLYGNKKGFLSKLKKELFPNNRRAYFFIKILNNIDTSRTVSSTFKNYLLEEIERFEITRFYNQKDKEDLAVVIGNLDEDICRIILKNLDLSIQNNKDQIDTLTKLIDDNFSKVRELVQKGV